MKFVAKELKETADVSSGRESWAAKFKNFGIVVASLIGLYLTVAFIAEFTISRISEETEQKIFAHPPMQLEWETENDHARMAKTRELFVALTKNPELRPLDYQLRLLDLPEPNAFAAPGGWVLVTSGLLEVVTNDLALGFVLAHELGHHQHRHPLKRLGRTAAVQLTFGLLFGTDGGAVVGKGVNLAEMANSRSSEIQADEFGFRLAYKTFGDADGYFEFFEWMNREREDSHTRFLAFINTHPTSASRIARLREIEADLEKTVTKK